MYLLSFVLENSSLGCYSVGWILACSLINEHLKSRINVAIILYYIIIISYHIFFTNLKLCLNDSLSSLAYSSPDLKTQGLVVFEWDLVHCGLDVKTALMFPSKYIHNLSRGFTNKQINNKQTNKQINNFPLREINHWLFSDFLKLNNTEW